MSVALFVLRITQYRLFRSLFLLSVVLINVKHTADVHVREAHGKLYVLDDVMEANCIVVLIQLFAQSKNVF